MFKLLEKYEDDKLLKRILKKLYDKVHSEVSMQHFFMDLALDEMLSDVDRFNKFLLDRPEKVYTDSPNQTAESANQVGFATFKEICHELVEILKEERVEEGDIPTLVTEIMEIVEESKAQASDRISTVFEVANISYDHLIETFTDAKIKAEFDEENNLCIRISGIQTPIYLRFNKKHEYLLLFGKVPLENNDPNALNKLVDVINQTYPYFPVKAFEEDDYFYLYTEKKFSLHEGLPTRLFIRVTRQFATFFESAIRCDRERILKVD